MIVFDLKCRQGHVFEAWFRSSAAWENQRRDGKVMCPTCSDTHIEKAIMAPAVSTVQNHRQGTMPSRPASDREQQEATEIQQEHQAAAVAATTKALEQLPPEKVTALLSEAYKAVRKIQKTVEQHADNVGREFAEEARAMHYGETDHRAIYGETTDQEAEELEEEGIAFARLPWLPKEDA